MRRGVTLIELLVVISILVLLAAVTIPNVKPAIEDRRARETARAVEAYLNRARIEAVERQRPVGVRFDRWKEQTDAAVSLTMVEMAPIYTGEDAAAQFKVQRTAAGVVAMESTASALGAGIVATGDEIQLGAPVWSPAGATYVVYSVTTDKTDKTTIVATLKNASTSMPWPFTPDWSAYQSFAVRRKPTVSSSVAPLLLMRPLCIDLYESGTTDKLLAGTGDVVILFSPDGGLHQVQLGTSTLDSKNICLLLTTMDRLPTTATAPPPALRASPAGEENQDPQMVDCDTQNRSRLLRGWRDAHSLWISVNYRNGHTTTAETNYVDQWQLPSSIAPAGQFNYNGRDSYGQPAHLFWGLRRSRALLREPMKAI